MYDIVVVIASFNRPVLIKQTIESIQQNSTMKVQIVVVDNSKNTETPAYLESLKDIIYYRFPKLDDDYDHAEDGWISLEATTRFGKLPGVIDPPVVVHCGATSFFKQDERGVINTGELTPTHPNSNIEDNKLKYPELIFE